ncbi:hypothetical protein [Aestuariibacter sp. A3R04]|uniref:hypothetical protein n=1 Tax=Aestuariibacter sp. A3R04 TaxID=2841571 RepID=UPI001C0974F3|nr:hypothetical protein [Aestuariibacter sp. A3R04]MBU3023013.1 hypothetical protein [Aestuariibacter sp. A3R04]
MNAQSEDQHCVAENGDWENSNIGSRAPRVIILSDRPLRNLCGRFSDQGMQAKLIDADYALRNLAEFDDVSAVVFCIGDEQRTTRMLVLRNLLKKLGVIFYGHPPVASAYLMQPVTRADMLFDVIQLSRWCSCNNMLWLPPVNLECPTVGTDADNYVSHIYHAVLRWNEHTTPY